MQLTSRHRRWLERRGWRTTLEYRENIIRDSDGRLVGVVPVWYAEGEQWLDAALPPFMAVSAATCDDAWRELRHAVHERRLTAGRTVTSPPAPLLVTAR